MQRLETRACLREFIWTTRLECDNWSHSHRVGATCCTERTDIYLHPISAARIYRMDHSHMDHSGMGHGDMGHGDMGGEMPMCNMNMLFTWDTTNLCIVFKWWHIRTTGGLLFSLLAVVALTAAYEAIRSASRRYEHYVTKKAEGVPIGAVTERTPFLWTGRNQVEVSQKAHVIKAVIYAVQTFYAFMLMLLFMTYNGWVMLAVGVGSFVGYLVFGNNTSATKDSACH